MRRWVRFDVVQEYLCVLDEGVFEELIRVVVLIYEQLKRELHGSEFWKFGQESHGDRGVELWCFEVLWVHGIEYRRQKTVRVDDRNVAGPLYRVVSHSEQEISDVPVHRTAHLGAPQVDFRLLHLLLRRVDNGRRLNSTSLIGLLLLGADREIGQALPSLGLQILDVPIGNLLL